MDVKIKCVFPQGELLFATLNVQDGLGNWQNRVISISSLSRNIGEDKSYEISGVSIEFNDTDRYFREMMTGKFRYIAGKAVEISTVDDELIYTGTVEKWQFAEDTFVLTINDRLSGLDKLIPGVITIDEFPAMAEDADGKSIPVIYGSLYEEGGAVKCWRVGSVDTDSLYLLARHYCNGLIDDQELMEPAVYQEDGVKVTGAVLYYTGDGYQYIRSSAVSDFVFANVEGRTGGGGALIEDPIDALKDLVDGFTDMSYNDAALNEAQTIMAGRGYKIAAVIGDQKNLNDVLVDFCYSFDCDFHIGRGNELVVTVLNRATLTPVKTFIPSQIVDFQLDELPEEIRNKVQYQYKYNYALEKYRKIPVFSKESSIINWGEFYNRNEALSLPYVYDDDSAFDVVQRYVIQRKNPKRIAQVDIPLSEFSGVDIADIVEMRHPGAVDANARKYQVRRVNLDFSADVVQVEALDITNLTGGIFVLGDSAVLPGTWEGQSEGNVHREYGYLADGDTGYFANETDYGKVLY